jgi:hypothetical protein
MAMAHAPFLEYSKCRMCAKTLFPLILILLLGLSACGTDSAPQTAAPAPNDPAAATVAPADSPSGQEQAPEAATPAQAESTPAGWQDDTVSMVFDCTETNPHPIGLSTSQTYQITYERVMTWFCDGYSFDNILVALETSAATGIAPDVLLEMLLEKDWDEIWLEIGLTDG